MSKKTTPGKNDDDADLDFPPVSKARLARMKRVSLAKFVRQKLAMTQEAFSDAFGIPVEKLRAWEKHEAEPDEVAISYLKAIARAPEAVRKVPA